MRVISYGAACGSAAAASADFPSTPGSGPGSDVAHVARAFSLGFAFTTPMLFTVCRQLRLSCFSECSTGFFEAALSRGYCASYDGPDEDLLSCSSDSDFTTRGRYVGHVGIVPHRHMARATAELCQAGSLEARGAFGAQSYACVKDCRSPGTCGTCPSDWYSSSAVCDRWQGSFLTGLRCQDV